MKPGDLLDRACISDVWAALGGGPLRHKRLAPGARSRNSHKRTRRPIARDRRVRVGDKFSAGQGEGLLARRENQPDS